LRYFIKLSYRGTDYHGWQYQPNAVTIQEELETVFSLILKKETKITGAGRTDTGVHALNYFAHFDLNDSIEICPDLILKANRFLKKDIVIHEIFKVKPDAHSRFSALSRTYEYRMHFEKNPFLRDFSYYVYSKKPDLQQLNSGAKILFEYNDFTSFSKLHTDTKTNICKIFKAEWFERNEQIIFKIEADRFLRNMVRAITGTLLELGKAKISINDLKIVIESKNRSNAGVSLPAHALFLTEIKYPKDIFEV
jgi:tRNA pseudouridine38-40 synthase